MREAHPFASELYSLLIKLRLIHWLGVILCGMSLGTTMLDGKRYYALFPDENPEMRQRMKRLFDALQKLEKEFRRHFEHFRGETTQPREGKKA
jgi:hypothetical protein